jgi:hypothetical protein
MADRALLADALVSVDLIGVDPANEVSLTVINPYGAVTLTDVAVPIGAGRYQYMIPAVYLDTPGLWINVWSDGYQTVYQNFTVGRQPLAGVTKHDLRLSIANRVNEVHYGIMASEEDQIISDNTLLGGSNEYDNWWVIPDPQSVDAGRFYRVTGFNGSGLVLSEPMLHTTNRGEPYSLMKLSPREVDRAMRLTIAELSPLSRIEVFYGAVPLVDTVLVIPAGITHVSAVTTSTGPLTPSSWRMGTGRTIVLSDILTDTVIGISGIRDASYPQWEDSIIECDEATAVARASLHLHAARAAGQGIDQEEHLRRQLAAQDEYERTKRNSVGRIPAGTRPVLE